MAIVPATEFKARCLELMDRVAEKRETYVITKRGRPVARLVPAELPRESVFGCMADQTAATSDLARPAWSEREWREFERQRAAQIRRWEREWRELGTVSGRKTAGQPPRPAGRRREPAPLGRRSRR